jgi:hypothetical protein
MGKKALLFGLAENIAQCTLRVHIIEIKCVIGEKSVGHMV